MIIVAVGGNLPHSKGRDVGETFSKALGLLQNSGVMVERKSALYTSPAWPRANQPDYRNAVWTVATAQSAETLLDTLHHIERAFGRTRTDNSANAARTLDLDLIDFDGRVSGGRPVLPHPRLQDRAFVLLPLADVAPDWRHPVSWRSVDEMIARLPADHGCRLADEAG